MEGKTMEKKYRY